MNKNHSDVEKFVKSLKISDNNENGDKTATNITIFARDRCMIATNGSNVNSSNHSLIIWIFLGITIAIMSIGFTSVCVGISNSQAERFAHSVKSVAACEDKNPNKVHNEMRQLYGYNKYANMSIWSYYSAMKNLSDRKCD